jgi:hypothetical protein
MNKQILHFVSQLGYWTSAFNDVPKNCSISITLRTGVFDGSKSLFQFSPLEHDYEPQNGDKVYFLPGVNVPRTKFKNLCDEEGIRTVRDISAANIIVGNNASVKQLTDSVFGYKATVSDFKELLNIEEFKAKLDEHTYDKIMSALEFYTEDYVLLDRTLVRFIENNINESGTTVSHFYYIKDEYLEHVSHIAGKKLYDESVIIDKLNGEDAAVINKEVYDQLLIMLDSSDLDNQILAMEIMANCKYSSSLTYLTLLFYYKKHVISNCSAKNHVNFKSLLSWLDLKPSHIYMHPQKIVELLSTKGQLTKENLDIILSYIGEDVAHGANGGAFRIKQLTLAPEFLEQINLDYTYVMQEDYVPVTSVESEPEIEYAVEDNFDLEEPEMEQIEDIPIEAELEEVVSEEPEIIQEDLSNNTQITQADESGIDWF